MRQIEGEPLGTQRLQQRDLREMIGQALRFLRHRTATQSFAAAHLSLRTHRLQAATAGRPEPRPRRSPRCAQQESFRDIAMLRPQTAATNASAGSYSDVRTAACARLPRAPRPQTYRRPRTASRRPGLARRARENGETREHRERPVGDQTTYVTAGTGHGSRQPVALTRCYRAGTRRGSALRPG